MNAEILDDTMIQGVVDHMNDDHRDACLVIVQQLGGRPDAIDATMLGMDEHSAVFSSLDTDGQVEQVRVDFDKQITRDSQVRGHLVALTKKARALCDQSL